MKKLLLDCVEGRVLPDEIGGRLPKLPADLKMEREDVFYDEVRCASVLIEGSRETLLGLAAYIIAQANDERDCGFQFQYAMGMKRRIFLPEHSWELYIHSLPCINESGPKA